MNRLVLKASAGTGKTYRLSLEYLAALFKGTEYRNILVMTFTKKATAEIKKEVLKKISNFIEIYHLIQNKNLNVEDAIKFSEWEEMKKNDHLILLENVEKILKEKITSEKLSQLYFISESIIKNKENMKIYTIDSFLNTIFKNIVVNFLKIKSYTMIEDEENNYYYKKILEGIFKDKNLFFEFKEFFSENSEKNVDNYINIIKNLIDGRWKYLLSISEDQNFYSKEKLELKKTSAELLKTSFDYIQNICKKDLEDVLKKEYKKYIGKSYEDLKRLFFINFKKLLDNETLIDGRKIKGESGEEIAELYLKFKENLSKEIYNEILIPYEEKLMNLNKEIYKIYDELKIRDRKFTFNDISVYTYSTVFKPDNFLIDEEGFTKSFFENLDMQIDTIFIDEFQDTSILQWKILSEILKQAKNVICVGDEKQSIYGWRGGEKNLFENLDKIIDANDENMDISYRSDINIVNYTNKLFNKISKINLNWKFEDSKPNSKKNGFVKCLYFEKTKDDKISLAQKLVKELKNTGFKNYSDVAIIARTNGELIEIASLLEEEKIPYVLSTKKNTQELSGVFEYLELLRYLIYDKELSLFNFLASDLSSFGTFEIEILLKSKSETLNYLYDLENPAFEKTLSEKILLVLNKIKNLKKSYKSLNSQELTYKIFEDFNFFNIFNKDFELKNLSEAYLLANKYENPLELLKAYDNKEIYFSESIIKNEAVQLMTIHKSKGLQFKTVFVLNKLDNKKSKELDFIFSMNKTYDKVLFSLFVKNGYGKVVENCFKEDIENIKRSQKEEEINNLYVAVTRAKNNLIIITENSEYLENDEIGSLQFFETENVKIEENTKSYNLKLAPIFNSEKENMEINDSKFLIHTEEKRMLGILIHYFLENIKNATKEEIEYSIQLCYKNYLSYFGVEKLGKIFSNENIEKIFNIAGDIFSNNWDYIYSEYEIYDFENKKSYRIDRIMIRDAKDNLGDGEIYIVDYKTGAKNEVQLENYKNLILENFGDELKNYKIRTKFLEFNIEY